MFFSKKESSGVFVIDNGRLVQSKKTSCEKSFNDVAYDLGYELGQVHCYLLFDKPLGLSSIGFLPFSKTPVFVMASSSVHKIAMSKFRSIVETIDWNSEYGAFTVQDILDQGISARTWSIDFMQKLFTNKIHDNQPFSSLQLGLNLEISNGFLVGYHSLDQLSESAKELERINPRLTKAYFDEAMTHHSDKFIAKQIVNIQAECWASTPGYLLDEQTEDYRNSKGAVNYFMLLVDNKILLPSKEDFLLVTKGISSEIENDGEVCVFLVDRRVYYFIKEELVSIKIDL